VKVARRFKYFDDSLYQLRPRGAIKWESFFTASTIRASTSRRSQNRFRTSSVSIRPLNVARTCCAAWSTFLQRSRYPIHP
jgi:hypothetical protein